MTITIQEAGDKSQDEWDKAVESSSHGTIFHTWNWLKIVEKQTGTRLIPLMAYKGTQLVALYPVFIQKRGIFTLAFSPPSKTYLLYLGPVICDYDNLKQDKRESLLLELQEGVDKLLVSEIGCHYIRIRPSPGIYDARYLQWTGYMVSPQYTHRFELSDGLEKIWSGFDRKLRTNINKAERAKIEVKEGNLEDLLAIAGKLDRRFKEQGIKSYDYTGYLTDLYNKFSPEHLKVFTAYYNGERAGGMVALCYNRILYAWIGIPKADVPGLSPNDLVQWEAIKWASAHGYRAYEMMSAGDTIRLRRHKAQYNPELCIWYTAEKYSSALSKMFGTMSELL